MEEKGLIVNIQKFSIHDGPGIRTTVFFKGCPLNCWWCHNPESIKAEMEVIYKEKKCIRCGVCGQIDGLELKEVTENQCYNCPTEALEMMGELYTVEELMSVILADKTFYENSNGGVTFSGGEPLMQNNFLVEIAKACKEMGVHVTVDTTGFSDWKCIENILPFVDVFLYDVKFMDSVLHRKYTGVDNKLILENLIKLSSRKKEIYIRIPVIPMINDSEENIIGICEILKNIHIRQVNLLPYHGIGSSKYKNLKRPYLLEELSEPSEAKMTALKEIIEGYKIKTIIGG